MRKLSFILISFFMVVSLSSAYSAVDEKLEAFNKSIKSESVYNYAEAIDHIKVIYSDYSDDYLVNLRLGWLYYQIKDYTRSIKYYKKAVEVSDESPEALLGLVLPYSAQLKWDKVTEIYKTILEKDEYNYKANLYLGMIYFNSQKFVNAKVLFEKLRAFYPSDYSANLYMGWTLYYLGDSKNAHNYFTYALIASPDDSSAKEGYRLTK